MDDPAQPPNLIEWHITKDGMMKRFSLKAYFGIRVRSSKGATVSYYYPFWRFSYIRPFAFFIVTSLFIRSYPLLV